MKTKNFAHSSYKLKIGNSVRKWRVIKDLKQKDLALLLHLSEAAVSNIENDITTPTLKQVEDLATALAIPVEMLLSGPEKVLMQKKGALYLGLA